FDSAALDDAGIEVLAQVEQRLGEDPNAVVVLEGRTDSVGEEDYNVRLGERRVEAVRRYLAVELGVPVYRIHGISYGEAAPLADNANLEERARNRSVSVVILAPAAGRVAAA